MPNSSSPLPLKKTPLAREHKKLNARMVPFAGWLMPVQYTSILEEHNAVRTAAGLFDVSHMGEFEVQGKSAQEFLQELVTGDLEKIENHQAMYTFLCYETGGTIDDLIIYKYNSEHFLVCVNASNIDKDFEWMRKYLKTCMSKPILEPKLLQPVNNFCETKKSFTGAEVQFTNISDDMCLLALQGPRSKNIMQEYLKRYGKELPTLKSFRFEEIKTPNCEGIISRTGYTGEYGYELFTKKEKVETLWNELLDIGTNQGLKPVGLGARDTLRLEMAYPLYGHELDKDTSPLEARLDVFVKLEKKSFIGREKLLEQKEKGCAKYLVGLELVERGIAREGYLIYNDKGAHIGKITSGTQSPSLKKAVAMAYVERKSAQNCDFFVDIRGKKIRAKKVELPFYKR